MEDSTRSQAILRGMEEIMNGKIQAQMQTSASKVREEQQKAIEELQQSTTAIKSSFDRIHDDMARLKEMIRALRREKIPPPASSIPEAQTDVDLGAPSVNSDIAPSIQPTPSNFPPSMSTNYGGQTTNNWGADSFMSSQGESYCPDSLYRDSNFGVHQHNSSNFGVPQQSNSDFSFPYSRTVLVKIHSELYPISHEVLDWFFSGIGKLESIECFDQWNPFHSRICFKDSDSAVRAVQWLNGSCIYNGCCQVELILEAETIDRANEMDASNQQTFEEFRIDKPVRQNPDFSIVNELQDSLEEVEDPSEADNSVKELSIQDSCKSMVENNVNMIDIMEQMRGTLREMADELRQWREEIEAKALIEVESSIEEAEDAKAEASIEEPNQEIEEIPRELQIQFRFSEVNSYLPNPIVVDIAWKERDELVNSITTADFGMIPKEFLVIPTEPLGVVVMSGQGRALSSKIVKTLESIAVAHKVFDKMSNEDSIAWDIVSMNSNLDFTVFDPGGSKQSRKCDQIKCCWRQGEVDIQNFYPGGGMDSLDCKIGEDRISNLYRLGDSFKDIAFSSVLLGCNSVTSVDYWDLMFIENGQKGSSIYHVVFDPGIDGWDCAFEFIKGDMTKLNKYTLGQVLILRSISEDCIEVDDKRLQWDPGILKLQFQKKGTIMQVHWIVLRCCY